eukprot:scaffold456040_cov42-Prasinocladus_malaysianus.AAC.1
MDGWMDGVCAESTWHKVRDWPNLWRPKDLRLQVPQRQDKLMVVECKLPVTAEGYLWSAQSIH